jgi:hypothetical protein
MDGYVLGFVALMGVMLFVGIAGLMFIALEGKTDVKHSRLRYTDVRRVTTNTIETVDVTGNVEQWKRAV